MSLRAVNYSYIFIMCLTILLTYKFWLSHKQEEMYMTKISVFEEFIQSRDKEYKNQNEEGINKIAALNKKGEVLEDRLQQCRAINLKNLKGMDAKNEEVRVLKEHVSQVEKQLDIERKEKNAAQIIVANMKSVQKDKEDETFQDPKTIMEKGDMKQVKKSLSQISKKMLKLNSEDMKEAKNKSLSTISNNLTKLNSEEFGTNQSFNGSQLLQPISAEYLNTSKDSRPSVVDANQPDIHNLTTNDIKPHVKQNPVTSVAKGVKEIPESKVIASMNKINVKFRQSKVGRGE